MDTDHYVQALGGAALTSLFGLLMFFNRSKTSLFRKVTVLETEFTLFKRNNDSQFEHLCNKFDKLEEMMDKRFKESELIMENKFKESEKTIWLQLNLKLSEMELRNSKELKELLKEIEQRSDKKFMELEQSENIQFNQIFVQLSEVRAAILKADTPLLLSDKSQSEQVKSDK